MSNNFLQLNNDKTEVILSGPSKTRNYVAGNLENLTPYVKYHVKNLGVIFDSELCLEKQISSVVKNSYYQLRIISRLKSLLSFHIKSKSNQAQMSFICHIHNYTEYNEEWNVFSVFNPSKWSSGQPTLRRPGSSWGFGALLKGLTSVVDTSCQRREEVTIIILLLLNYYFKIWWFKTRRPDC